jgi:uncharacterized membrane protein SpoIIM required for sporulation
VTQQAFIKRREKDWKEIEAVIAGGNKALKEKAAWFPGAFRKLSGDLNTARAGGFDPSLVEKLNRLTLEGNQILSVREPFSLKAAAGFLWGTFPRAVRAQWKGIAACLLIFYGLSFLSALVCVRFPDFTSEILSPWTRSSLEDMYDPSSSYYLHPREISTDADMFGFYIYNNISIAFWIFAAGILAGAGSILMLAFNAVFVGAAAGHIVNSGFSQTFFSFVIGHSGFELTAIAFAAQAGLHLGYRFFVTKGLSRGESLREAGKTSLPIIAGATAMLVMAALLEAFWSSRHEIPAQARFAVGGCLIFLIVVYFVFAGRGRKER